MSFSGMDVRILTQSAAPGEMEESVERSRERRPRDAASIAAVREKRAVPEKLEH
jgi:hypothetical protein